MVTLFFYSVNTLNNEDYFLPGVRGVTVLLLLPGCRAAVMNGWRWGAILPWGATIGGYIWKNSCFLFRSRDCCCSILINESVCFGLALLTWLVCTSEFWELRVAVLFILSAFFGLKHTLLYHSPRCGMDLHPVIEGATRSLLRALRS